MKAANENEATTEKNPRVVVILCTRQQKEGPEQKKRTIMWDPRQ